MEDIKLSKLVQIWGKTDPFHPLLYHMVDVGHIGQELINSTLFNPIKSQLIENLNVSDSELNSWLGYLLSLHDIGKIHPAFQMKAPDYVESLKEIGLNFPNNPSQKYNHALFGGNWIKNHLKTLGWGRKMYVLISGIIIGHHGNFAMDIVEENLKINEIWDPYRVIANEILFNHFRLANHALRDLKDHSKIGVFLIGILVLSDWVASNDKFLNLLKEKVQKYQISKDNFEEYCKLSKDWAKITVNSLGFNYEFDISQYTSFNALWKDYKILTSVQNICDKNFKELKENKLIIIEAPMGMGKTEAALYIATQYLKNSRGGFYFALPTMATSNQMYGRVREFLNKISPDLKDTLQLIHGMAWMIDKFSGESALFNEVSYDWFKPKKRALLAPFGVGTIDQCLMSGLWVKFGFLRLLGLAEKILIIDEVHAYDAYMTTILIKVLNWAYSLQIPVIILSATLPISRKRELLKAYNDPNLPLDVLDIKSEYPLVTVKEVNTTVLQLSQEGDQESSPPKIVNIILEIGLLEDFNKIADLSIQSALENKCICVIINSVKNSQKLFEILKEKVEQSKQDIVLNLFHARFPIQRRLEIEGEVIRLYDKRSLDFDIDDKNNPRPKRSILVATQVVEQSLDLDFDEMISEIAPIDLLIQRMGRIQRHPRKSRPCGEKAIYRILLPNIDTQDNSFGITGKIYHQNILIRTMDMLLNKSKNIENKKIHFELPLDIRLYIDEVYCEGPYELKILNNYQKRFKASYESMVQALLKEENEAKIYLIPQPNSKRFEFLGRDRFPFSEEDSKANTFFYAKTRIGDTTTNVILLDDPTLEPYILNEKPPNYRIQKKFMKKSVSLPKYWFSNTQTEFPVIKWLSHSLIINLKNNICEYNLDKDTKKRRIINHPICGVFMEEI